MLRNISLIWAVSMVIASVAGFIYFERTVREQKISDQRAEMHQLASQLEFALDDVEKFAQTILVDRELQKSLAMEPFASEYQEQDAYDCIANRLIFYNNLRTYVYNSMLKMESGIWYGTSFVRYDEEMPREEIIQQHTTGEDAYSNVYYLKDEQPIICYQVQMYDKYQFGQQKGTLYLEIYLEHFLEQIDLYAQTYPYVCLLSADGSVLYEHTVDGNAYPTPDSAPASADAIKVPGGYMLREMVETTGWQLCALISNQYLWERSRFVFHFFLISFLASLALSLLFVSRAMENAIRPITKLSEWMAEFEGRNVEMLDTIHTGDEIQTLYECCGHMVREIRRGEEERVRHARQEEEMQFDIMLSQINPHYLYNVLHTVVYLAAARGEKDVVEIVHALLYSLQETLNIGEHSIEATIRQELELTRCYLKIQEYRYPGAYTVDIQCEEALEGCTVPKTIIQPLVENAIFHGILPVDGVGHIAVRVFTEDGQLRVLVENDGVGISDACLEQLKHDGGGLTKKGDKRKHIGISNIRDRIRFLYGPAYGIEIGRRTGGGTRVLLRLPLIRNDTPAKGEM